MKPNNSLKLLVTTLLLMSIALITLCGCPQSESQAVREIATQAMSEQAEQNRRVTDATGNLVAADARAREELIESHARLQETLQKERTNLDQQQSELNELRESIERDRQRAPIIAEAIHLVGGIFVCLVPLLLAGYVLFSVNRTSVADEGQIVNEILISELTSDAPRLLPNVGRAVGVHQHAPEFDDRDEIVPPY